LKKKKKIACKKNGAPQDEKDDARGRRAAREKTPWFGKSRIKKNAKSDVKKAKNFSQLKPKKQYCFKVSSFFN